MSGAAACEALLAPLVAAADGSGAGARMMER
jgi:hypothetical protein